VAKRARGQDPRRETLRRYVTLLATFGVVVWIAALYTLLDGNRSDALSGFLLGLAIILSAVWVYGRFKPR
jgi:uncharacterized membrane protein YjjP (DUF1212 family)